MSIGNDSPGPFDEGRENARDLLPIFALGGLTEEEARILQVELDRDSTLEDDLYEWSEVVGQLGLATPSMRLSKETEASLMERVAANSAARFGPPAAASPVSHKTSVDRSSERPIDILGWFSNLFTPQLVMAGSLAGFLVMAVLSFFLSQQLGQLNDEVASLSGDKAALEIQMANANEDRQDLVTKNEDLQTQVSDLSAERTEYEANIGLVTADNISLTQQVNKLTEERDNLTQQVADLSNANLSITADNIDLGLEVSSLDEEVAALEKIVGLFDSPQSELFQVAGTEVSPSASGQIVIDPDSDVAILSVANLPELSEGEVYQVLLIRGDAHDTAETFEVDAEGEGFLIVRAPSEFSTFDTLGISIEPEGGSIQRTGEIVMVGSLIN